MSVIIIIIIMIYFFVFLVFCLHASMAIITAWDAHRFALCFSASGTGKGENFHQHKMCGELATSDGEKEEYVRPVDLHSKEPGSELAIKFTFPPSVTNSIATRMAARN